jgi:succinate dehydrogenase assembly factor 2
MKTTVLISFADQKQFTQKFGAMFRVAFSRVSSTFSRSNYVKIGRCMSSDQSTTIPPYQEKFNEEIKDKRARLVYQSRKRGMLENGLLLGSFSDRYLDKFNSEQLSLYDRLINLPSNDWDIFYWATGVRETPQEFNNEIMDLLKEHTKNEHRESRLTMPNLKQKQ